MIITQRSGTVGVPRPSAGRRNTRARPGRPRGVAGMEPAAGQRPRRVHRGGAVPGADWVRNVAKRSEERAERSGETHPGSGRRQGRSGAEERPRPRSTANPTTAPFAGAGLADAVFAAAGPSAGVRRGGSGASGRAGPRLRVALPLFADWSTARRLPRHGPRCDSVVRCAETSRRAGTLPARSVRRHEKLTPWRHRKMTPVD
jgi:hypothetical protein